MAQASHKITEFPVADSAVQTHLNAESPAADRDASRELRNMIEELQNTAREARRQQRQAEEEREQMRGRLLDLQERMDSGAHGNAQIKALIRERDMLLEQQAQYGPVIADLKQRLKASEAEMHEAQSGRDTAVRERKQAQRLHDEAEERRAEACRQRDAATRQRDLAKAELEQALDKVAAEKKNFADAQKALAETQKALAEARQERANAKKKGDAELSNHLDSLRHARDGMAAQIRQLKERVGELEDQKAEIEYVRDSAEKQASDLKSRLDALIAAGQAAAAGHETGSQPQFEAMLSELQSQLASATETNRMLVENEARLAAEIHSLREGAADGAEHPLLAEAQAQIEALTSERDDLVRQIHEITVVLERQIHEQATQLEEQRQDSADSRDASAARDELQVLLDRRRLEMIDMATRLENAQREIKILGADLAEARLHAKMAGRQMPAAAEAGGRETPAQPPEEITAMRRALQSFTRDQRQTGLLGEIEARALKISTRAGEAGQPILHSVCATFASLLRDLTDIPEQITQARIRTLGQTIEFAALLAADPEIEKKIKFAETRVFIVDDEPAACSMIADALSLVGLRAGHAHTSSGALAELSSNPCDLIILDVHLPETSGFELSAQIRGMAAHKETPIFFVTGDSTLDTRVKSSLRGANEFISKPFIVQEVALKAAKSVITRLLRSR